MERLNKGFLIGLGAVILTGFLVGIFLPSRAVPKDVVRVLHPSYVPEFQPVKQSHGERVWKNWNYTMQRTVKVPDTLVPARLHAHADGSVSVLNLAVGAVQQFSPDGSLRATVPAATDANRETIGHPRDFTVASDDRTIWLADANGPISSVDPASGVAAALKPEVHAFAIAWLDGQLVVMPTPRTDNMFATYTPEGKRVANFGRILQDQRQGGIITLGRIAAHEASHSIIFAGTRAGLLGAFGADGTLRFLVQTIEATPLPDLHVTNKSALRIPYDSPSACISMSVSGDEVYVLGRLPARRATHGRNSVIDVYDARNGTYLYSLQPPMTFDQLSVRQSIIYTADKEGIQVWSRES